MLIIHNNNELLLLLLQLFSNSKCLARFGSVAKHTLTHKRQISQQQIAEQPQKRRGNVSNTLLETNVAQHPSAFMLCGWDLRLLEALIFGARLFLFSTVAALKVGFTFGGKGK